MIETLPTEVMLHILRFLPRQSLGAAAGVCRAWNSVLQLPYFWRLIYNDQFGRYPANHIHPKEHFRTASNWTNRIKSGDWTVSRLKPGPLPAYLKMEGTTWSLFASYASPSVPLRSGLTSPEKRVELSPHLHYAADHLEVICCLQQADVAGSIWNDSTLTFVQKNALPEETSAWLMMMSASCRARLFFSSNATLIEFHRISQTTRGPLTWLSTLAVIPEQTLSLSAGSFTAIPDGKTLRLFPANSQNGLESPAALLNLPGAAIVKLVACTDVSDNLLVGIDTDGVVSCWQLDLSSSMNIDPLWSAMSRSPDDSISTLTGALHIVTVSSMPQILCYNEEEQLVVLDVRDGKEKRRLEAVAKNASVVGIEVVKNAQGNPFAIGLCNERVHIWSLDSGAEVWVSSETFQHLVVIHGPDGPYLVTRSLTANQPGGLTATVERWRVFDGDDHCWPVSLGRSLQNTDTYPPALPFYRVEASSGFDTVVFSRSSQDRAISVPELWDFNQKRAAQSYI